MVIAGSSLKRHRQIGHWSSLWSSFEGSNIPVNMRDSFGVLDSLNTTLITIPPIKMDGMIAQNRNIRTFVAGLKFENKHVHAICMEVPNNNGTKKAKTLISILLGGGISIDI